MKAASICRRCAGLLKAAMLGGIVFAVSSAPAQQQMTQAEIRACLCQQEAMNALRLKQAEDQNFFQRASPLERQLTEQIDHLRSTMHPDDKEAQEQLRALIDQRSKAEQDRRAIALRAWQDATDHLVSEVVDYNAKCVARTILETDAYLARQGLVCSATP